MKTRAYLGNYFAEGDLRPFEKAERGGPAGRLAGRLHELERDMEELCILTRALVDLLREKSLFFREELKKRVIEMDITDGIIDGHTQVIPNRRETRRIKRKDQPK